MRHILEYSQYSVDFISIIRDILEEDDLDIDDITISQDKEEVNILRIIINSNSQENKKFIKSIMRFDNPSSVGRYSGPGVDKRILNKIKNSNKTIKRICKLTGLLIRSIDYFDGDTKCYIQFEDEKFRLYK